MEQIGMGSIYSIIESAIDSWNKIQKNLTHYWKIYPPVTLKKFLATFILNHINNFYSSWNYIHICSFP